MRDVHVLRYDVQCTYILLSKFECKIEVCARESEDGVNLHFAHIIVTLTNLVSLTRRNAGKLRLVTIGRIP